MTTFNPAKFNNFPTVVGCGGMSVRDYIEAFRDGDHVNKKQVAFLFVRSCQMLGMFASQGCLDYDVGPSQEVEKKHPQGNFQVLREMLIFISGLEF